MKIAMLAAANCVHAMRFANAFKAKNLDVCLISLNCHKAALNAINCGVHYLKSRGGPLKYHLAAAELKNLLKDLQIDILNVHYASGYATLARLSKFQPTLLNIYGSDVYEFPFQNLLNRRIAAKNIKYAAKTASTSHAMKAQTDTIYKRSDEIFITPFGVDTSVFVPNDNKSADSVFKIGLVKTLQKKYGVEYLIRAVNLLRFKIERPIMVEIYGDGAERNNLETLVVNLNLQDIIKFKGKIPHADVPHALKAFDVCVIPSLIESFGVSAIEAMACEIPIITSDAPGLKEVNLNNVTGFVVLREDCSAIADKLHELLENKSLRSEMGNAGRKHVKQHYEWSNCVNQLINCINITYKNYSK